mmetsp:Transcript_2406/g.5171  ORF Transcript_2406/g.5171 Transcript_2406/m.5171 type:complete len:249 (-) Transcript_2406:194-940(-)
MGLHPKVLTLVLRVNRKWRGIYHLICLLNPLVPAICEPLSDYERRNRNNKDCKADEEDGRTMDATLLLFADILAFYAGGVLLRYDIVVLINAEAPRRTHVRRPFLAVGTFPALCAVPILLPKWRGVPDRAHDGIAPVLTDEAIHPLLHFTEVVGHFLDLISLDQKLKVREPIQCPWERPAEAVVGQAQTHELGSFHRIGQEVGRDRPAQVIAVNVQLPEVDEVRVGRKSSCQGSHPLQTLGVGKRQVF